MTFVEGSKQPMAKVVPFKKLQDVEGYISIQDGDKNWVMKIDLNVMKVLKVEGVKDAEGRQAFNFLSANHSTLLTPEEYKIMTGRTAEN